MAVGETDGAGSEESGSREADVISRGNILESFTESQEVRALLGNLRTVYGDPVAQEVIVEKFIDMCFASTRGLDLRALSLSRVEPPAPYTESNRANICVLLPHKVISAPNCSPS